MIEDHPFTSDVDGFYLVSRFIYNCAEYPYWWFLYDEISVDIYFKSFSQLSLGNSLHGETTQ